MAQGLAQECLTSTLYFLWKRRVDPALIFGWFVCLSVAMITEYIHVSRKRLYCQVPTPGRLGQAFKPARPVCPLP